LFTLCKRKDPLILHDVETKDEKLRKGIQALQGFVFRPSILSFPRWFGGSGQTLISEIKEKGYRMLTGPYKFDKRELIQLSDKGQIYLEYKFHGPVDCLTSERQDKRPILCVLPGLTGDNTKLYVHKVIDTAYNLNFDVILINHRGLGGAPLTTPRLYSASSWQDSIDAVEFIHNKFPK
jgi:predicted alpha/beta-fold hydrolase